MDNKFNKRLYLAWIVALIATLGSLFFSEIAGFIPCKLCWFQRIGMYPLTVILGVACIRNDKRVGIYILPITSLGVLVSLFHLGEQHFGWFEGICRSGGVPCSGEYINWFGFITIPLLALTAFLIITVVLVLELRDTTVGKRHET